MPQLIWQDILQFVSTFSVVANTWAVYLWFQFGMVRATCYHITNYFNFGQVATSWAIASHLPTCEKYFIGYYNGFC